MIKKRLMAAAAMATLAPLDPGGVWRRRRVQRRSGWKFRLRHCRQPDGAGLLHR